MKAILCLAIGLVLLSGGALLWKATRSASKQQTTADLQRAKYERIVRDYYRKDIDSAKEVGKKEVILPPAMDECLIEQSLDELLRDYGLLRVKVVDEETTVSDQKEHRLVREIEERYGGDLDLLRSGVQLRQGREK